MDTNHFNQLLTLIDQEIDRCQTIEEKSAAVLAEVKNELCQCYQLAQGSIHTLSDLKKHLKKHLESRYLSSQITALPSLKHGVLFVQSLIDKEMTTLADVLEDAGLIVSGYSYDQDTLDYERGRRY